MIIYIFTDTPEKSNLYWARKYYKTFSEVSKLFPAVDTNPKHKRFRYRPRVKYLPLVDYVRIVFDADNRIDAYFYPLSEAVHVFRDDEIEYIIWRGQTVWQLFAEVARVYFKHFLIEETEAIPDVTTEFEECV